MYTGWFWLRSKLDNGRMGANTRLHNTGGLWSNNRSCTAGKLADSGGRLSNRSWNTGKLADDSSGQLCINNR